VRHIEISAAEGSEPAALRAAGPVSPDGRPFFLPARLTFDCGGSDQAATFWLDVCEGRICLNNVDDRLIWTLRAQGADWATIAQRITEIREERSAAKAAAANARWARRWRSEYRRNLEQ
jgi:hypothetical protein